MAASGCAAPFGPGYAIEKQRIEVTYSLEAPNLVTVRGWYRVRNTGTQPLEEMSFQLPLEADFAPQNVHAEWGGKPLASPSAPDEKGFSHVALGTRWSRGDRGEFALSFDLKTPIVMPAATAQQTPTIFLPRVEWFPNLIAPPGNFATGGKGPPKWDLIVSLPQDYHVHASGNPRGTEKLKARHGPGNSWRFEQISLSDFPPYVVAGPYIEEDVKTPTGTVILWTSHPVPEQRAYEIGDRISADVTFFKSEFGSPDQDIQRTWIVECPQPLPTEPRGQYTRGCLPMPGMAAMPKIFFEPNPLETQFLSVDYQLVLTWFMHSWSLSPSDTPWLMRDVGAYAVHSLLASRDATSREATIRNFVHYLDYDPREKQKPLIASTLEDSLIADGDPSIRSQLFFFALEDRCGSANLHHALARLVRILHGQTWGISDLRSAVEAECGTDLADFFRQWLNRPGIPEDFRARYAGSTVAAPKQPGQK